MQIDIWSDFVCPFCYIGKRRLEQAIGQLADSEQQTIDVVFRSFELDPNAPRESQVTVYESLARKYGMSIEKAKEMTEQVKTQAATVDLAFQFEQAKETNTFDAHRLAKFAETKGKGTAITERLLSAYFCESLPIDNHETLVKLAGEVGLDTSETHAVLKSEAFSDQVRSEEAKAQSLQVRGVPYFVINQKYSLSGAQPTDVFSRALKQVLDEEKQELKPLANEGEQGAACSDGSCEIPNES